MNPTDRRRTVLRRMALLCAALVLAIVGLSAHMRLVKAGLGCSDWPGCYGRQLREARPGVAAPDDAATGAAARVVHRIAAVAALLVVVSMVVLSLGRQPAMHREGTVALGLLGLALFLAVLGRWTAQARAPAVPVGNLLGGFAMLALSWRLAAPDAPRPAPRLRTWARWLVLLLLVQIALGGLVSAGFAGLSCDGWAACLAAARELDWSLLDPWREPVLGSAPPYNPDGALAQLVHRAGGALVLGVAVPLGLVLLRQPQRRAGIGLLVLVSIQAALGPALVMLGLPLWPTLAHNLVAALLLALVLRLA